MGRKNKPPPDEASIDERLHYAASNARRISDYFGWPDKATQEKFVVATAFASAGLDAREVESRGNDDPPDCQAVLDGKLVGIEVTEFVSQEAIEEYKISKTDWGGVSWDRAGFVNHLRALIERKDKPAQIKGGPYAEYFLIIHTDENMLARDVVAEYLEGFHAQTVLLNRVLFLVSYDPRTCGCPVFELKVSKSAG
jgi:hypothetical protein